MAKMAKQIGHNSFKLAKSDKYKFRSTFKLISYMHVLDNCPMTVLPLNRQLMNAVTVSGSVHHRPLPSRVGC